jgi:hypothetical protein
MTHSQTEYMLCLCVGNQQKHTHAFLFLCFLITTGCIPLLIPNISNAYSPVVVHEVAPRYFSLPNKSLGARSYFYPKKVAIKLNITKISSVSLHVFVLDFFGLFHTQWGVQAKWSFSYLNLCLCWCVCCCVVVLVYYVFPLYVLVSYSILYIVLY